MRYVEFKCECGAMNCSGNPEFHEPVCHKCGVLGSWFPEFDAAIIQPDDPMPVPFADAIIQPNDPIPPRGNLIGNFARAMWQGKIK